MAHDIATTNGRHALAYFGDVPWHGLGTKLDEPATAEQAMEAANSSNFGLTAGFYGAGEELEWFLERIEAGVVYCNRPQGATTGAWPGYQPFGGWKGSGSTGKSAGSFYYLQQYMREQSQTIVD